MRTNNIDEKKRLLKEISILYPKIHVPYAKLCNELEIDYTNFITSFKNPARISIEKLERMLDLERKYYEDVLKSLDHMVMMMFVVLRCMQKQQKSEREINEYKGFMKRSVTGNEKVLSQETIDELKKESII